MPSSRCLLVFLFSLLGTSWSASEGGDIRVAVDRRLLFGYMSLSSMWNQSDLFDIRVVTVCEEDQEYYRNHIDLTIIDRPIAQHACWRKAAESRAYSYAIAGIDTLAIWDNKLSFKRWMMDNGFENFVLAPLDPKDVTFPVVLKVVGSVTGVADHVTSGKSVFFLSNQQELDATVHNEITKYNYHKPPRKKFTYFLEPALTSSTELTVFVTAYKGELLSARCNIKLIYGPKYRVITKSKFHRADTPCGSQISRHAKQMVSKTAYTGTFCLDAKFKEGSMDPYYVDNNPRLCGSLTKYPRFFVSAYLPLAVAIQKANCLFRSICQPWAADGNSIIHFVVTTEKAVALTGDSPQSAMSWYNATGGVEAHREVPFNPSRFISQDEYFVNKRNEPMHLHKFLELHREERRNRVHCKRKTDGTISVQSAV